MKTSTVFAVCLDLLLVFLICALFEGCWGLEDVKIDRIRPNRGGTGGAVKIIAYGKNFDVELDWTSNKPRTKMYLASTTQEYECDFHQAESDEQQAVCYTRPMEKGYYWIRMRVADQWLEKEQYCGNSFDHHLCRFQARANSEPTINSLDRISSPPHQVITINGKIFTDIIASSNATASNGNTATLKRVWMTSGTCDVYRDVDDFFGLQLKEDSNDGEIKCKITSSYVGNQNVSFIVEGEYGRSVTDMNAKYVSADDRIYMIQTYAVVEDVEPKIGSIMGGVRLKIKGKYFDDSSGIRAKVEVGGTDCKVEAVTDDEIICVVDEKPGEERVFYPGGRGVQVEMLTNENITFNDTDSEDYLQFFFDSIDVCTADHDLTYKSRARGFFLPSVTSIYRFFFSSEDGTDCDTCQLHMDIGEGLVLLTEKKDWSDDVILEKGKEYYYEVSVQMDGTCGLPMKLNVYVAKTKFNSGQLGSAVENRQQLYTRSTAIHEIQMIETESWEQASAVDTQLNLTLSCELSCYGQRFRVSVSEMKTVWMERDERESEVSANIQQLAVFTTDEKIKVVRTIVNENTTSYQITIQSKRGDFFPYFKVETSATLEAELTSLVTGSPDYKTLTFEHDGILSTPIPVAATAKEMTDAILQMFEPKCPQELSKENLKNKAFKFFDMETQRIPTSATRSSEESFCGTYSASNLQTVFENNDIPIRLNTYKHFCFAYLGEMKNFVKISYTYYIIHNKKGVLTRMKDTTVELDGMVPTVTWNYLCYNLDSILKAKHQKGNDFRITKLQFQRYAQTYVDDVFFGVSSPDATQIQGYLDGRIPPAVEHIKIKSAEVKVNATLSKLYEIELISHDCGHNYPLFGFAFLGERQDIADNETLYGSGRNKSQVRVTRVSTASPPIGGSFDIYWEDDLLEPIYNVAANITQNHLKLLLENVEGIDIVRYYRWGNCRGYNWIFNIVKPGGRGPKAMPNGTNLTGVSPTVQNYVHNIGGMKMEPIPGDFFRTAHTTPQVQVYINNVPSSCVGDFDGNNTRSCSFEWLEGSTANVDLLQPTDGSESSTIIITGSGFDDVNITNNVVLIADVSCSIISASQTNISCTVGKSPAGRDQPVVVKISGQGLARMANVTKKFTVNAAINSISPSNGGQGGCNEITIAGTGFDNSITSVQFGTAATCDITSVTYEEIVCMTTSSTNTGVYDVIVTFASGENVTNPMGFEFVAAISGNVTSVSTNSLRSTGNESVTISGSGFGTSGMVKIGRHSADVTSWKDDVIIINTPSLSAGEYQLKVHITGQGCALTSTTTTMSYKFSISSLMPTRGSIVGGTEITVQGEGLGSEVSLMIGESPCDVISVNESSLVCVTTPTTTTHRVDNMGSHQKYGIGYGWKPDVLRINVGDEVNFRWATPEGVMNLKIGPFTCSDPISEEYDEDGFNVPPTPSGSFTYRFTESGTFYYKSISEPNSYQRIEMPGRVIVSERSENILNISAIIGDHEATQPTPLTFTAGQSDTPLIHGVSPLVMNVHETLEITAENMNSTPSVKVGGKECSLTGGSEMSLLKCKISVEQELAVGRHALEVNVPGMGNAMYTMKNLEERSVVFYPTLDNITPTDGSLQGHTLLTIQGSGFSVSTRILIGTFLECQVVEHSYTTLACWTPMYDMSRTFQVTIVESGVQTNSTDAMTFSYSTESTPFVNNITVDSNNSIHYNLTVTGTGFGTNSSAVKVVVGPTSPCIIDTDTFDDGQFFCRVTEQLPLGKNPIKIDVAGKGSAKTNSTTIPSVESKAEIFSIEPLFASLQGGTKITITGNGFIENSTIVKINGLECELMSVTLGSIICVSAAQSASNRRVQVRVENVNYPTPFSIQYSDEYTPVVDTISPSTAHGEQTIELEGSKFGNQSSSISITSSISEESLCNVTMVNDTRITCTLGPHEGGPVHLKVHVAGKGFAVMNAEFNYSLTIDSINPTSGSFGGRQQVTINGQGFSTQSVVTIDGRKCDMNSSTSTQIICYTPAQPNNDTVEVQSAEVLVTNGDSSSSKVTYNYQLNQTAVVSSVSPNRGGTGGGTVVTITGNNFRVVESEEPIVMIGGTPCKLQTYNDTAIICETEPRPLGSIETQVEVFIGDYGIARQDDAYFYYIDRWSSIFTWGGTSIPTTKDFVIIPKGKTILLDTNTDVLIMLLVDGGKLIFDDTQDVSLHAENILLTNGGVLQVGTEEEPYEAHAEIVLYGQLRSPELPIFGAKTLAVRDGTLDLHGRHIPYTWSKLSETVSKGSSQIKILHSVNWRVNDELIIATTGLRHSQEQSEKRKITAISDDGKTLTLDEALEFEHLGIDETFGNHTVEFRAEVGLLSRNIVIRGSNDPQWHDEIQRCEEGFDTGEFATQTCFQGRFGEEVGSDQFGGSIMIHAKEASSFKAIARIEYTELTYMGQAFRLGRYPIHWHLMGDVTGMYVRGCSLHKTFNRAVAIHGTDNLLVDRNVIYDIMGGAFFIEDGIETGITLQYNLAIFVRQSTSLLNDDVTPAAYWVTNPNNTVIHNHAAGGTHFGFWYRMHEHPDGPSFTEDVCQQKVELGRFANNTVHSQGWFGLWIFQTYTPVEGGQCSGTVPSPARFHSLTTWNSEKGAEWVECSAMQFHDFVMVNNEVTGIDTKFIIGSGYGYDRGAMIKGGLIVGHSTISSPTFQTQVGITLPFAPGLTVEDVEFRNFDRGRSTAFRITTIDGTCSVLCGGFYYIMKGLTFHDVSRRMRWRWEHEGVLQDQDGSLTGSPNHKVVPFSGLVNSSSCQIMDGDLFSSGALKSLLCPPSLRFHRFAMNSVSPSSLATKDMIITNEHGETTIKYAKKRLTHKSGWMGLLYGGDIHKIEWKDSKKFTNVTYKARIYDLFEDDYLYIRHSFDAAPDVVQLGDVKVEVSDSTPLTSSSSNLTWYFNPNSKNLDYIVANQETSRRKRSASTNMFVVEEGILHVDASPRIYRCKNAGCVPDLDGDMVPPVRETPDDAFTWSSLKFGPSDTRKKRSTSGHPCVVVNDDSTIEILKSAEGFDLCWCLIDIPTVNINHLIVKGVVQFSNDVTFPSYHFSAYTIQVLGGRIIAGHVPEDPFLKQLTINLKGEMADGNAVNFEGVTLGTKALGCFGGCDFHGISHNVYWTHLSETVEAGSSTLKLIEEVDWKVGDEIVVTTTSYSSNHTEKLVISGVSGKQLTVDTPLQHRHLGKTYTINNTTFDMRAEVGLLTRNIKIQGEIYDKIDKNAFGARVLVGYLPTEDTHGWARISNVEFIRAGQEGFTEAYDPRFALVWLNTGLVVPARPSFVQASSFHHCYSTGIGVFGADGIHIKQNIVHRPIHDGIRIGGTNIRVEKNLVAKAMFRGSYWDRFEDRNYLDWHASFMLTEGRNITLIDNVAAGSERLCFHIEGVDCSDTSRHTWRGNVAHGCLHGVHLFPGNSAMTCALIQNFVIYKSWDFGLYHQTTSSVTIRNVVIADSQIGYTPIIFGPPSLSHRFVNKVAKVEGMLLVGRSDDYDENVDTMDEDNDKSLIIRRIAGMSSKKPPPSAKNGKIGILLPMFASSGTGAPDKTWIGNTNYPAIRGLLDVSGVTFYNFKETTNGNRDLVFQTNTENEDAYVPTYVTGAKLVQVDTESLVIYERPSLGKINPSDCVDMECDGMKNVLIKDLDGGLLGSPGSIIPDAGYGWDDDSKKQRGLGDYRIPKTMLTRRDGTRIEVKSIIDHRGIVGTEGCTYNADWQAYNCNGEGALDYAMMVIESMDSDTETRRLSPIALLGNKYIDLENGPQDHGWCAGYTCQKRLSTFFAVVAASTHYDIYFTGYPPLDLRIHFLNVAQTKTIRLGIFYPKPERLDVYNGNVYIHPLNQEMNDNGKMVTRKPSPENPNEYKPAINASIHGSNYMDRRNDILYLTIRGSDPIDIKTAPAVIVKFGFPATAVDDFFEANLIANLASYLEVPPHKIKIVDIVRETSRKRRSIHKRSAEEMVTFVFEFDEGIVENEVGSTGGGNTTTDKAMLAEIINNKTDAMIKDFQTGVLASALNVSSIQLEATVATMELPPKFVNETKEVQTKILLPNTQNLTIISTSFEELSELLEPSLNLVDTSGSAVLRLGGTWIAQIILIPQPGVEAKLLGTPTVDFKDGAAMFKGLGISNTGNHIVQFKVVEPQTIAIPPINVSVQVVARQIRALVRDQLKQTLISKLSSFMFDVRIADRNGGNLTHIGYKGNQWKARVELAELESAANVSVTGKTEFLFDNITGETGTDGLMLSNPKDYYRYMFKIVVFSDPPIYDPSTLFTPTVQVYSPNNTLHLNVSVERKYKMSFGGKVKESGRRRRRALTDDLSSDEAEEAFAASFNNHLVDIVDSSYIKSVDATENDATTDVEFTVASRDEETAAATESSLEKRLAEEEFVFEGKVFTASDPSCFLEVGGVCKAVESVESVGNNNANSGKSQVLEIRSDVSQNSYESEARNALQSWQVALIAVGGLFMFASVAVALLISSKRKNSGNFKTSNSGVSAIDKSSSTLGPIKEEEESRQKVDKEEMSARIEEIKTEMRRSTTTVAEMKRSKDVVAAMKLSEIATQSSVSIAPTEQLYTSDGVSVTDAANGNGFLSQVSAEVVMTFWDFNEEANSSDATQKKGNEERS